MFPVAEFFLPPTDDEELPQHVARAIDYLGDVEPTGDVLIFLPGEREIRECADVLEGRNYPGTEVLPLFARLGLGDQQRVFNPGNRRALDSRHQRRGDLADHPPDRLRGGLRPCPR
jgi:ATP-dependent helicase HrpA